MALQLDRAKNLLVAHPDLTVLTVAVRCGFSSDSHLGRRFHTALGCSPAAHRRATRGGR